MTTSVLWLLASVSQIAAEPPSAVPAVAAIAETAPVASDDDAADDSAIWVHPSDRARSVIIATNKQRGLVVYGLDGAELSEYPGGRPNNVDVRQSIRLGGIDMDLVVAGDRSANAVVLYTIDPTSRELRPLLGGSIASGLVEPYGVCVAAANERPTWVFACDKLGAVRQWALFADETGVRPALVREFGVGGQCEGMVADEETGTLFIGEEDVGVWAYGLDPDGGNARRLVDAVRTGGPLSADVEGVTIFRAHDGGGYLLVSSQGSNSFVAYDRLAPHAFIGAFRISGVNPDGCEDTDGIEVSSADFGGAFTGGMFIAQDGMNVGSDGSAERQNFKLVAWDDIVQALRVQAQRSR